MSVKTIHTEHYSLGKNSVNTCCQSNFNAIEECHFIYLDMSDRLHNVVAVARIYPKDQNPRRSQRDWALANIKQKDHNVI